MEKYILLAEICFDWSGGEYYKAYIDNIYLGCEEFNSKEKAQERATILMQEYCENNSHNPQEYNSTISVKKI